jgi:hypothetical protein
MAFWWMIFIPSRMLSILSSIMLSIDFRANKTYLSSRVSSLYYYNSRSIGRLAFLNSYSDEYLLLFKSFLILFTSFRYSPINLK